jgi:hypothetical protein
MEQSAYASISRVGAGGAGDDYDVGRFESARFDADAAEDKENPPNYNLGRLQLNDS